MFVETYTGLKRYLTVLNILLSKIISRLPPGHIPLKHMPHDHRLLGIVFRVMHKNNAAIPIPASNDLQVIAIATICVYWTTFNLIQYYL